MRKRTSILIAIILAAALIFSACATVHEPPISITEFALDTVVTISLYKGGSKEVLQQCTQIIKDYEKVFSKTIQGSDVWNLNNAQGQAVEVSAEMLELMKTSLDISKLSQGAFDVTIGAVSSLWNFTSQESILPEDDEIKANLKKVDYNNVVIKDNTILLKNGAQIDLGSVAKGYISNKICEFLRAENVKAAIVDLGGNIEVVGNKFGRPWNVGIQDPKRVRNVPMAAVKCEDLSVVTSGIYERNFVIDDKMYYHLLDPKTGYPVDNNLASVTVIGKDSEICDALSTVLFVLGEQKGKEFIENYDNYQAIFIDKQENISYSSGIGDIISIEIFT